ncbi:MAG: hypothetical protein PHE55_01360 [Methylococcaceae bacterium]|nr:hypothetical protein [Methylococcaceae bacterium]
MTLAQTASLRNEADPVTTPAPAVQNLDHPDRAARSVQYSGWRLRCLSETPARATWVAFKEEDRNHEHPALILAGSDGVVCEGYWPFRPSFSPKIILGGVCLYTRTWGVQFAAATDSEPPATRSLALPGDLQRALGFLKKGRPVQGFHLPTRPGHYHRLLIGWQRQVLDRFPDVESIHYTLPVQDYHGYIMHFEDALGEKLPGLHAELDAYVETLKDYLAEVWGSHMDKIAYDIPGSAELKRVNATARENDLQLYLKSADADRVMGMEDLPEVALPHEVARRSGVLIPCAVSVLALPDPYMAREDSNCACRWVALDDLR